MKSRLPRIALSARLALTASVAVPALVACAPALVGCTGGNEHGSEYETTGVVRAIDAGSHSMTIQHDDVPGYMPAMTMPFDVADPAVLSGVGVGDRVRFRFSAEPGGRHVVRSIRKL